jgi:hypothetical protein
MELMIFKRKGIGRKEQIASKKFLEATPIELGLGLGLGLATCSIFVSSPLGGPYSCWNGGEGGAGELFQEYQKRKKEKRKENERERTLESE